MNGVVWYLLGVIFVLVWYPRDVAVEAILLCVLCLLRPRRLLTVSVLNRLSWADTAASTFGRMFGHLTPLLPVRALGLPIASRKSFAGVLGSFVTSVATTYTFWGFCTSGMRSGLPDPVWKWEQPRTGGWLGLGLLSLGAGIVTSFVEVLGTFYTASFGLVYPLINCLSFHRHWCAR